MISKEEFNVLYYLIKNPSTTQQEMADALNVSLEETSDLMLLLKKQTYITEDGRMTENGYTVMKPYKVKNAIILAAGFASRCVPLSYERPKGLFVIKGEILIERQIRQLLDKGITKIYVVVGYKKELFFYLEKKYGVKIIINTEYMVRNNLSSINAAREQFGNSYICYSDNYLNINGYETYVYESYFAGMYSRKYIDEYAMKFDKEGLIKQYYLGDANCWYQMGEMYFDQKCSKKFLELMDKEYDYPSIYDMKIDDFYIRHLSCLDIYIKRYPENAFLEFDTIADIKLFDNKFVQNMGENILTNICEVLKCNDEEIVNIQQIKRGQTNIIFSFECRNQKYIYRHPGVGTEHIIDRYKEAKTQCFAKEIGLDPSLIKCNPENGWKIAKYIENVPFEYNDREDEKKGIELIRKLHFEKHYKLGWNFDFITRAREIQNKISKSYYNSFEQFEELRSKIEKIYQLTNLDNVEWEMCHNDICANNILLGKNGSYLIDWEYAGDNDPAADIASYIINYDNTSEDCDRILKEYFQRELTREEQRHYYAYIAITAYFYFSWAVYMESSGHDIGEFSYLWFNYALYYSAKANDLYDDTINEGKIR